MQFTTTLIEKSRIYLLLALFPALMLTACGTKESGNYRVGEDDPALEVVEADIEQVDDTIALAMSEAQGAGLLDPPAGSEPASASQLPPDHPVVSTPSTPSAAAPAAEVGSDRKLKLRDFAVTLPEAWKSVTPDSSMRLAQIEIPHPQFVGENTIGELTVFYFGPSAGSIQANIDRWVNQMAQPDGSSSAQKAKTEQLMAGSRKAVLVDVSGTMAATSMPGVPPKPEQPNSRLLAAIVMTEEGPYFFKATGPEETMAYNRDKMVSLIQSFEKAGDAESQTAAAPAAPAASTPMPEPAQASASSGTATRIEMQSLEGMLPASWKSVPPSSSMRLAQIEIPPTEGDSESGVMTVFYFGPSAGSIDMNIDRWYGQFSQPDGRPTSEVATRESLRTESGMDVAFIDLTGTMLPSSMPGVPPSPEQPNSQLLGAIVLSPEGPYFFKATGPEKTLTQNRDTMVEFLQSLRTK